MKFFKYLMVFAAGAGVGTFVTKYVLEEKCEKLIQQEVNDVTKYYKERIKQVEEAAAKEIKDMVTELGLEDEEDKPEDKEVVDDDETESKKEYEKINTDYSAMFKQQDKPAKKAAEPDPADKEYPQEDGVEEAEFESKRMNRVNEDDPYIITTDAFEHENLHYDKVTITYYVEDDVLADENDEIISDVDYYVGDDALVNFGAGSEDPDIVYVRNEKISTDYEVIRVFKSYSKDVLGLSEEVVRPPKSSNTRKSRKVIEDDI